MSRSILKKTQREDVKDNTQIIERGKPMMITIITVISIIIIVKIVVMLVLLAKAPIMEEEDNEELEDEELYRLYASLFDDADDYTGKDRN